MESPCPPDRLTPLPLAAYPRDEQAFEHFPPTMLTMMWLQRTGSPDMAPTVQELEMYGRQVTDFALLHAGRTSITVIWRRKGGPIDNQGASHGRIMD
jgi:hypothetical protein